MSRRTGTGYKWKTETTHRVREFLKENRVPIRMLSDNMFFQSMDHLPHRDLMRRLKVRKKDLVRILSLLEKEKLIPAIGSRHSNQ